MAATKKPGKKKVIDIQPTLDRVARLRASINLNVNHYQLKRLMNDVEVALAVLQQEIKDS